MGAAEPDHLLVRDPFGHRDIQRLAMVADLLHQVQRRADQQLARSLRIHRVPVLPGGQVAQYGPHLLLGAWHADAVLDLEAHGADMAWAGQRRQPSARPGTLTR